MVWKKAVLMVKRGLAWSFRGVHGWGLAMGGMVSSGDGVWLAVVVMVNSWKSMLGAYAGGY